MKKDRLDVLSDIHKNFKAIGLAIKKAREITIDSLELVDYNGSDLISFKTICSSGTYIRSLASDLAKELGTHGYLEELQRSKIGDYTRENCLSMEELVNGNIKR